MLMDLFMLGWQVHTQCASILRHKLIKNTGLTTASWWGLAAR